MTTPDRVESDQVASGAAAARNVGWAITGGSLGVSLVAVAQRHFREPYRDLVPLLAPIVASVIQWATPIVMGEINSLKDSFSERRKISRAEKNLNRIIEMLEAQAEKAKDAAEKKEIREKISEFRRAKVEIIYGSGKSFIERASRD